MTASNAGLAEHMARPPAAAGSFWVAVAAIGVIDLIWGLQRPDGISAPLELG
jgi:hypothetical protein